jgi:hypothetical protein
MVLGVVLSSPSAVCPDAILGTRVDSIPYPEFFIEPDPFTWIRNA